MSQYGEWPHPSARLRRREFLLRHQRSKEALPATLPAVLPAGAVSLGGVPVAGWLLRACAGGCECLYEKSREARSPYMGVQSIDWSSVR